MADAAAMARANEPVPDMVKQFVVYFYRHIRERTVRVGADGDRASTASFAVREGPPP